MHVSTWVEVDTMLLRIVRYGKMTSPPAYEVRSSKSVKLKKSTSIVEFLDRCELEDLKSHLDYWEKTPNSPETGDPKVHSCLGDLHSTIKNHECS